MSAVISRDSSRVFSSSSKLARFARSPAAAAAVVANKINAATRVQLRVGDDPRVRPDVRSIVEMQNDAALFPDRVLHAEKVRVLARRRVGNCLGVPHGVVNARQQRVGQQDEEENDPHAELAVVDGHAPLLGVVRLQRIKLGHEEGHAHHPGELQDDHLRSSPGFEVRERLAAGHGEERLGAGNYVDVEGARAHEVGAGGSWS